MKADQTQMSQLLKTARGQIDGVLKMMDEDKYCIDIVTQIMASDAILRKAAKEILRAHITVCVTAAFEEGDLETKNKKIDELLKVFDKLSK